MRAPDVIVVGAGVFGCAVAYALAQRGGRYLIGTSQHVSRLTSHYGKHLAY